MRKIRVISGELSVGAGQRVALSTEQAQPRAHKIDKVKGERGIYVANAVLQFKVGEELGLDEVGKAQRDQIEEIGG